MLELILDAERPPLDSPPLLEGIEVNFLSWFRKALDLRSFACSNDSFDSFWDAGRGGGRKGKDRSLLLAFPTTNALFLVLVSLFASCSLNRSTICLFKSIVTGDCYRWSSVGANDAIV